MGVGLQPGPRGGWGAFHIGHVDPGGCWSAHASTKHGEEAEDGERNDQGAPQDADIPEGGIRVPL